jgi:hypothetical protein
MKHIIIFLLIVTSFGLQAQYNHTNLKLDPDPSQPKYKFENLQLYPIRATTDFVEHHGNLGTYLTLEEALEQNEVRITEVASGNVNTLYVENNSSDTVMILSGEVIQGGKQDRMIAQDVILYPKSEKREVAVFCVEHGRWQAEKGEMSFNKYYTISSNEVRKAGAVNKNQQEVWDKVSETTTKNGAGSSTQTLTALKNSEDFNKELKRYSDHFSQIVREETDVIGVVAVSGNVILGCDMFANHRLLTQHYSNLINSYAAEAITSGKTVTISYEKVKQYLDDIIADERTQEKEVERKGTILKDQDKKLHISIF